MASCKQNIKRRALCSFPLLSSFILLAKCVITRGVDPSYGVDVSYPIRSKNVSTNYAWLPHNVDPDNNPTPPEFEGVPVQMLGNIQEFYDDYMQGCRDHWGALGFECDNVERDRIQQNIDQPRSMVNYTEVGYEKIRAPEHIFKMVKDFWDANKDNESDEAWFTGNTYVNYWQIPSTMVSVENSTLIGGGKELKRAIWDSSKDIITEWTGKDMSPTSLYGVRVYKEGAVLATHVDRNPLISSAIINVDQDVDEPWPIEVIGHDGIAKNITMEPGDMVLYESHSILHGRPFPLKGRFFANIFIHFEPDPEMEDEESENNMPHYLLEGSPYATQWLRENENKEDEHENKDGSQKSHIAAREGKIKLLKRIAEKDVDALHLKDANGWMPIHEGARSGHLDVVQLLLENGADSEATTFSGDSPLSIAMAHNGKDHPVVKLLQSHAQTTLSPDL